MNKNISDQIATVIKRAALKIADVEYRLLWNAETPGWDVLRNGILTEISGRRKRKSAEDSAIRNAKAELETSEAVIVVTCVTDRKLVTLWRQHRKAGRDVRPVAHWLPFELSQYRLVDLKATGTFDLGLCAR